MTTRSVTHATVPLERVYPPKGVFFARSDLKAKAQWFVGPEEWELAGCAFDFRVGTGKLLDGLGVFLARQ